MWAYIVLMGVAYLKILNEQEHSSTKMATNLKRGHSSIYLAKAFKAILVVFYAALMQS